MKKTKELKQHALSRIRCCWGECCAVFFIIAGELAVIIIALLLAYDYLMTFSTSNFPVWLAVALTSLLASLLWLAVAPFTYGVRWYRIQQIRGNVVFARSMFSCYASLKKMLQVLKLNSMLALRRFPVLILICGAIAAEFYMVDKAGKVIGQDNFLYNAAAALMLLLAAIGVCLFMILGLKYAPVPYLYALDPDSPPKEIISKSLKLMKDSSHYLIETMLSVAGWFVPCILIFPMVFVVPYIQMVYTAAINEIIEHGEEPEVNSENEQYEHKQKLPSN